MANRIRTDLADMGSFSNGVLTNAALAYEALAEPPDHPLHVKRKRRGDERQTGFVLQLVDAATAIFWPTAVRYRIYRGERRVQMPGLEWLTGAQSDQGQTSVAPARND